MAKKIKSLEDVVNNHLCTGCGVCAYLAIDTIKMVDDWEVGRRPVALNKGNALGSSDLLKFCPGWNLSRDEVKQDHLNSIPFLRDQWGNVLEVWEVYAGDEIIRNSGSSGGVITALSLYCLEIEKMAGVLNTHASAQTPITNDTSMSTNREQLMGAAGSRYSPSSPCEKLSEIEDSSGACAFVGKPCDVAAVNKVRKERKQLDTNLGVVIAFFCAGVPSTAGVQKLIDKVGVNKEDKVESLRFRGNGWPGLWALKYRVGSKVKTKELTYQESWGFLQKYRQWRCYICPDHTGEFADISVGDPWYRAVDDNNPGKSLVLIRTPVGRKILHAAVAAGYIVLENSEPNMLPKSQPNLISTKSVLWGRLLALKITGVAVPVYKGFMLFDFWAKDLSLKQKINSILGTIKRVYIKKLNMKYSMSKKI